MDRYRILILGNSHFGATDIRTGAKVAEEREYMHTSAHFRRFVESCESFVLNLKAPLVGSPTASSRHEGRHPYVHGRDPHRTMATLKYYGVDAVNLANDYSLSQGLQGWESTFQALSDAGIEWFGAGRTLDAANVPYRLHLPLAIGGGEVHFHGSYQYSSKRAQDSHAYATNRYAGCAPLELGNVSEARAGSRRPDSFHVAFPHWGEASTWRSPLQYRLAHRFLKKDYDLVLGHGAPTIQEIHRKQQRWVVYGLGDGALNSGSHLKLPESKHSVLPYSLWSVLEVQRRNGTRRMVLKLYPVHADNANTGFEPKPLSESGFRRVVETLADQPIRPWRFNNSAQRTGVDDLGHFMELNLGQWDEGQRPARLPAETEMGDPGDWVLQSPGSDYEDAVIQSGKPMGAGTLSLRAEASGGTTYWLSNSTALIQCDNKRMVVHDYRAHESSLGASVVSDKWLTSELFDEAGILTPTTIEVSSAEEAVIAAESLLGPVVVKPVHGKKSKGVSTNLTEARDIREAYSLALEHGPRIIVQQHIEASEELRVMASPVNPVAVIKRIPPHVIGDGTSTIRQLIEDKNSQRALNPSLRRRPIPLDNLTQKCLSRQDLTLDDALELGRRITVRDVAGLSVGADAFQALELTDQETKDSATGAVAAIPGLNWGGVDLIVEKSTGSPYVIEINTQAAYGAAEFPTYGRPRDVGADIWKLRCEATVPEVTATAPDLLPRAKHESLICDSKRNIKNSDHVDFSELFEDYLHRSNLQLKLRGIDVLQVYMDQNKTKWVTRGGLTEDDKFAICRVLHRHRLTCLLLDKVGIPRPHSRVVTSPNQLERFVTGLVRPISLLPVSQPWNGLEENAVTWQEARETSALPEAMWAQARPAGRRVRVLATSERAWAATSKPAARPLSRRSISAASQMAVRAIRAVPELRWAAVDILVRSKRLREGAPRPVLVEGLTITPKFSSEDQIIAGDFDDFAHQVLGYRVSK